MISLLVVVASVVVQVLAVALALRLTTRWARLERRSWKRVVVGAIAYCVVAGAAALLGMLKADPDASQRAQIVNIAVSLIVQLAATFLAINLVFGSTALQTLKTWLGPVAVSIVLAGLAKGVITPYVAEGYVSPTNAMSPALCGTHAETRCTTCGGTMLLAASPPFTHPFHGPEYTGGICSNCYTSLSASEVEAIQPRGFVRKGPDRFSANKLRTPSRWDMTVYLTPDRKLNYVHRVVGLPGETVQLQNNQLLINGQPVTPPVHCAKIHFGELSRGMRSLAQALDAPMQLGQDEYFVIGDNQSFSLDSRLTGPVTRDRIVGVVDLIYWPPGRMQVLP